MTRPRTPVNNFEKLGDYQISYFAIAPKTVSFILLYYADNSMYTDRQCIMQLLNLPRDTLVMIRLTGMLRIMGLILKMIL